MGQTKLTINLDGVHLVTMGVNLTRLEAHDGWHGHFNAIVGFSVDKPGNWLSRLEAGKSIVVHVMGKECPGRLSRVEVDWTPELLEIDGILGYFAEPPPPLRVLLEIDGWRKAG